jgi:hypothetical protein
MLTWHKDINGYNGHWMGGYIGFDDDCPLYKVGEDGDGWYYEYLPDGDGMDGYDTYQEAMADAAEDWELEQERLARLEQNSRHEPMFTPEEWDEILGDLLADEHKEEKMGW